MSTPQKPSSVGCLRLAISLFFSCLLFLGFLFAVAVFVEGIVLAGQYAHFPQNRVRTQATVVDVQSNCGKHYSWHTYTVQFTDQAGHVQTGSLSCESITLSRGNTITIFYAPFDPTLVILPDEGGIIPGAGVVAAVIEGLIALGLLVGCIFWVRHEKHILSQFLRRRNRANSPQPRLAEQVVFARPIVGSPGKDEKWTSKQGQEQPGLFDTQDEQGETYEQ